MSSDDQRHLLNCLRIKLAYPELLQDLNYNNIFETDTQKQVEIAKILERAHSGPFWVIRHHVDLP